MLLFEILVSAIRLVLHVTWPLLVQEGPRHWTYSIAESTTCTVRSYLGFVGMSFKLNRLIAGVEASQIAFTAVDTKVLVDYWELLVLIHFVNMEYVVHHT